MALSKDKKKEILESLTKTFKEAVSVVFVNFHGVNVNDATLMRRDLKKEGVSYIVAKKTLVRKALEGQKAEGSIPELVGELGIAYSSDPISPARGIYAFQKKLDNKIAILGGIFEGKFVLKDEMVAIAQIPSQQTLYAQFVNLINSPIQGLVIALNEIAETKTKTN